MSVDKYPGILLRQMETIVYIYSGFEKGGWMKVTSLQDKTEW